MSEAEPNTRARRYLRTARLALADGDPDSAANRAYYAAYAAAYDRLLRDCPGQDPPRTHKGLLLKVRTQFVLSGLLEEQLAAQLSRLMQRREQADYLESPTDPVHAEEAIVMATRIVEAFELLSN